MKITTKTFCILGGAVLSTAVSAEQQWSDFSLSYLKGSDYEVVDPDQQTITVEHASGHNWGDNFFFVDRQKSDDGDTSTYFELSPRLSLGYATGSDLSFGPVRMSFLPEPGRVGTVLITIWQVLASVLICRDSSMLTQISIRLTMTIPLMT